MKRYYWIDWLKVLGIYLVILGHTEMNETARAWIYSFHMPLFFFISGFLLKPNYYSEEIGAFFKKRIYRLIVYFLAFTFFSALIYIATSQTGAAKFPLKEAIFTRISSFLYMSGTPADEPRLYPVVLWYFPALITGLCILFFIQKSLKQYAIIGVFLAALSAILLSHYILPWEIESGLAACVYIYIGYRARESQVFQEITHRIPLAITAVLIVGAAYLSHINGKVNFRTSEFGYPILALTSAMLTIFGLVFIFSKFPRSKIIESISRNTIYIFPTHIFAFRFYDEIVYGIFGIEITFTSETIKSIVTLLVLSTLFGTWERVFKKSNRKIAEKPSN